MTSGNLAWSTRRKLTPCRSSFMTCSHNWAHSAACKLCKNAQFVGPTPRPHVWATRARPLQSWWRNADNSTASLTSARLTARKCSAGSIMSLGRWLAQRFKTASSVISQLMISWTFSEQSLSFFDINLPRGLGRSKLKLSGIKTPSLMWSQLVMSTMSFSSSSSSSRSTNASIP